MSVWAINCGSASLLGLMIYLFLETNFELPVCVVLPSVLASVALFNFLFARHAKAYFIAFDHLLDPHERGGGDDGGNQSLDPGHGPTEPCETATPVR